jgi:flagellar biosynthesis/type III secretory pathway chaperone
MSETEHTDQTLQELRLVGEELRQVFAAERVSISKLDHPALVTLAEHKERLANKLADLRGPALAIEKSAGSTSVRDLFAAIQIEARATAMLAATATEAVRALLGYQSSGAYDRRAKQTHTHSSRLRGAY